MPIITAGGLVHSQRHSKRSQELRTKPVSEAMRMTFVYAMALPYSSAPAYCASP